MTTRTSAKLNGRSARDSAIRHRNRLIDVACCIAGGIVGLAIFHGRHLASGLRFLPGDDIDARFVACIMEHLRKAALGRAAPASPSFFFPTPNVLGYSDAHVMLAIPHFVFRSFGLSVLSAAAASVILANAATWVVTFSFLRFGLGFRALSALIGSYVFVFSGPKLSQMSHLQHQPLLLVPATAWCLTHVLEATNEGRERSARRALWLCSILFHLQLWTSFQTAWMWGFELGIVFALVALRPAPRRRLVTWALANRRALALLFAANAFALVPFAWVYLPVAREQGWRTWAEVVDLLPGWSSYLLMGNNLVWGGASRRLLAWLQRPNPWEHMLGLGVAGTIALLASFAWSLRRFRGWDGSVALRPRSLRGRLDLTMLASLAALVLFVLTFQIAGWSLWYVIWATLPGAGAIRTVSRYSLVTAIGLALFCAAVADVAIERLHRMQPSARRLGAVASALVALALVGEQAGRPPTFDRTVPDLRVAALIARLDARPDCRVFAITYDGPRDQRALQVDAMLASLEVGRPTVNGYSSWFPKDWALWALRNPNYGPFVKDWAARNGLGEVCQIRAGLGPPPAERKRPDPP